MINHQLDAQQLVDLFKKYNDYNQISITRTQYEKNLNQKMQNDLFLQDVVPLIRAEINWKPKQAFEMVMDEIISLLPGERWRGE